VTLDVQCALVFAYRKTTPGVLELHGEKLAALVSKNTAHSRSVLCRSLAVGQSLYSLVWTRISF